MNSIDQDIFPRALGFPPLVNIRRFSIRQADDATIHLLQKESSSTLVPIGMALHISDTGDVEFVSLANSSTAHIILFDDKKSILRKGGHFRELLSSGEKSLIMGEWTCCLVGFSIARTAVQVSRATNAPIKGVDMNTLDSADTWKLNSAADVVAKNVSNSVDKWKIHRLWLGHDDSAPTDVCLQAWVAAWCSVSVFPCSLERCADFRLLVLVLRAGAHSE